jgi:hypothetical protein
VYFSGNVTIGDLPGFDLFLVVTLVVFVLVPILVLVEVVIVFVVWVVDRMFKNVTARHFVTYGAGLSAAAAVEAAGTAAAGGAGAAAAFGGGYVVQKWRPHWLQTQNWSGVQGVPSPGSRISISAPQR